MILTAGPSITQKEIDYVNDAVKNGWNNNWNLYLSKLESSFKEKFNTKYSLLTSSCTGAMHLAIRAMGIGEGDEVIVPELTWVATASVVNYVGATPVFVDVDLSTWTMDPESFRNAITEKTKAVMPVHLYGHPAKMDEIVSIAREHNLKILEDAAPAIGAKFDNKYCGTFGDVAAFSFQGAKMMVTGEGGIVITNDDEIFANIKQYSEHGRSKDPDNTFWIETIGYKYKMSNIQAAIGCAQMERIGELITRKREIFATYQQQIEKFSGTSMNYEPEGTENGAWMPTVVFSQETGVTCEFLLKAFNRENIDARVFFSPLSSLPMFEKVKKNFNSYLIPQRAVNLPSYHDLSHSDQERVVETLESVSRSLRLVK